MSLQQLKHLLSLWSPCNQALDLAVLQVVTQHTLHEVVVIFLESLEDRARLTEDGDAALKHASSGLSLSLGGQRQALAL